MGVNIAGIEELEDRVKVHLFFENQSPIPNKEDISEVLYADIPSLPPAPEVPRGKYDPRFWAECVFVPRINKTLEYHFREWQETSNSQMQSLHGGPYLVKNSPTNRSS